MFASYSAIVTGEYIDAQMSWRPQLKWITSQPPAPTHSGAHATTPNEVPHFPLP